MKVLIISSNRNHNPVVVMPYGAAIVAQSVHSKGHNVKFLDMMFSRNPYEDIARELEKFNPDIVGISVRNIDNNDMENTKMLGSEVKPVCQLIKTKTKAKIILGGSAVKIMPEEIMRETDTDVACVGMGEIVFNEYLDALKSGKDYTGIPGLASITGYSFRYNPMESLSKLSIFSDKDFYNWVDTDRYVRKLVPFPIRTKVGCPYECVYCTYPIIEGDNYVLSDPKDVVKNILQMVKKGYKDFEFVDNVFNSPYEHTMAVLDEITRAKIKARFCAVDVNPGFVNSELMLAMEAANFKGIGITAESASDIILKNLGKNYTKNDLLKLADIVAKSKIPCFWIFLIGGPGETKETVRETFNFAKNCIRKNDVAFFNVGIRVYPGTKLEKVAREEGVLNLHKSEMLEPFFYLSPLLDRNWINAKIKNEINSNMNFIDSNSFSFPFLSELSSIYYSLGGRPPLWKKTGLLRRTLKTIGVHS
ncbi:MAG: radical SAM protein [Elusimicrobia bacterium]|nr:radical SAM protein [Elusimicrobiota bacterium]